MALRTTTNINIDFYDKKYILINAKQLDRKSRFLSITCYDHGEIYPLNEGEHSAYVRYKKADNNSVFNFCEIDRKGKIVVELTEQMLAADGICCADLVIVNEGGAKVDVQTGEIIGIENTSVLSTMPLHIDVTGTATENSSIESSYEFDGLNTALEKAEAEYTEVIRTSKSWAVGDTGIRDGENTDNAKYYAKQSSNSANAANTSALNAAESERIAGEHKDTAIVHSGNAYTYMTDAKKSMDTTEGYMDTTKGYMDTTEGYMTTTNGYMGNSKSYMDSAEDYMSTTNEYMTTTEEYKNTTEGYMNNAESYMDDAKTSEDNALVSANKAQSYAVGGTGTRTDEDYDNAHYYYNLIKNIVIGLDTGFIPMGTVSFSELASVEKATGYVYNISDDFVTDETFREGEGKSYTAGTNVYYCANGVWDAFGGASSPTATVGEVKDYLGI